MAGDDTAPTREARRQAAASSSKVFTSVQESQLCSSKPDQKFLLLTLTASFLTKLLQNSYKNPCRNPTALDDVHPAGTRSQHACVFEVEA